LLHRLHGQGELGRCPQGLIDDAIALGELDQVSDLVGRRVGVELEAQTDVAKADGRLTADAARAAKIEIALDMTEEMLSRSRAAAAATGLNNVEFRQGVIEALPIEDGWATL
jgi:ubiquinone/menaquinone biosynthesis C-methylase UbiE